MLMAAKFGVPVCPHAGGVGLCEHVDHLIMIDYTCISASLDDRVAEYVDHLHEHFEHPVVVRNGRYMPPTAPGLRRHDETRVARALRLSRRRGPGASAASASSGGGR
jgi:L-alanine-DL-glutamate epimerase-like enolase superfamily enzyme